MNPVMINEAEAFIEPFFESGSSKLYETFSAGWLGGASGRVRGGFAALEVDITAATAGVPALELEKSCDLDLSEFDQLRMLLALPSWAAVRVELEGDTGWQTVIESDGLGTTNEYEGALPFSHVTGLRLTFSVLKLTDITAAIRWIGVADTKRVDRMINRPTPYTTDWPLMLQSEGSVTEFEPQTGIYFSSGSETEQLRARVQRDPHKNRFDAYSASMREHLSDEPEKKIGKLMPKPDRRFCRDRDIDRTSWAHLMEDIAFVGLIEKDEALLRMAARMALSAAHCEYWFESDIGVHPGKIWHHRSFTEEIYCRACALVLDWAGECFTDYGKQVVRNAISIKGLPRIESDFKEHDYIWHMNQGIVFSSGRIHGLLSLVQQFPRYAMRLDEAEHDIHQIIDDYVKDDGGVLEGPGYWHYTFMNAMATVYVLARYRGKPLNEYASESLLKTGAFELGMLSTVGGGNYLLPINDCHRNAIHPDLAAAYASMTGDEKWRKIYSVSSKSVATSPSYFSFIIAPDDAADFDTAVEEGFRFYPTVGHVDRVVADPDLDTIHFHFVAGPAYSGHYNCDKGSFILEAGEEILAIDRGVTNYSHPETNLLKRSARHNLLQPEPPSGPLPNQLSMCNPGAVVSRATNTDDELAIECDVSGAWPEGMFLTNTRTITSDGARVYLFEDSVILGDAMAVSFRINSNYPIMVDGNVACIVGEKSELVVTPINWEPREVVVEEEGIDGDENPVNLLRLVSASSKGHELVTRVEVISR